MIAQHGTCWRGMAGQPEQVIALLDGEAKAASDRREHLLGGLWTAALFQAAEVVH
jgi:hypothetical protein